MVRLSFLVRAFKGSNPFIPKYNINVTIVLSTCLCLNFCIFITCSFVFVQSFACQNPYFALSKYFFTLVVFNVLKPIIVGNNQFKDSFVVLLKDKSLLILAFQTTVIMDSIAEFLSIQFYLKYGFF